ncbi:chemotaxis protein CheW [Marinobacter oulmenensis]|uniref:Purine-binding chemotaxis protein CheW n=1 Tax=Marinobacter oulmenensis TaxID=643747 RepID=A0A840UKI5_9GAMM|nr:chemotaxis protein CheW [Marinobacter oulmenensis]MBB5321248.1 purine-binding chemotaxis protein CheW [Marinobacter oulmenensis]
MANADKKMTQLAEPEAAVASYLDELLHTATSTALEEEAPAPSAPPAAPPKVEARPKVQIRTRVEARTETETRVRPEPAPVKAPPEGRTETKSPPVETPAPVVTETAEPEPQTAPEEKTTADRPDWSEEPFECLIFTVAGLKLAVPLVLLGAIHRLEDDDEIRPIPGSPRWYMGIRPDQDQNLRVVDSAEWIMAGRVPEGARENYRFVIRLDDSEWGLACDEVAQSFTLRPEEVRWRTGRSRRPWLAGTVIDHMCALIDVRAMANLLVRAEREHHLDLS